MAANIALSSFLLTIIFFLLFHLVWFFQEVSAHHWNRSAKAWSTVCLVCLVISVFVTVVSSFTFVFIAIWS